MQILGDVVKNIFKKYWYSVLICSIILLGILLRLKGLLINPSMWHDECALAWSVKFKTYMGLFGDLRFGQVAPPLFMVAAKFVVNLFNAQNTLGMCDLAMRVVPFFCGCLAIGVFYLISKELFQTKKAVILSLFFFAVNNVLIQYSFEFKQYESDMFFVLLLILFFIKLNLQNINYKKLVFASLGIALTVWFSFVSVFFIAAGFINLVVKRKNFKKIFWLYLPIFISILLYLKFYILGTYHDNGKGMIGFWGNEFILPNFSNFLYLFVENIRYFFFPVKFILFILILSFYGIFIYLKEKKYDFVNVISLAFIFLIVASILHIYPFAKRLILFLVPIFILLITKPFDKISFNNKIKSFFVLIMLFFILLPQAQYMIINLTKNINKGEFPREMMDYMAKNLKPDDKIFLNKASNTEFYYYASFYNIKNEITQERLDNIPDKKYLQLLNNLPKGNYWFFMPYDYSPNRVIIDFIKDWTKLNAKIIFITEATQSVLMYVRIN